MENNHTDTVAQSNIAEKKSEKFGNQEKYEIYRKTRDFVVTNKVLRLYSKNVFEDGTVEITICNMYKLSRHPDHSRIKILHKNVISGEWHEIDSDQFLIGKHLILLPVNHGNAGEKVWRVIFDAVVRDILTQFGAKFDDYKETGIKIRAIHGYLLSKYVGKIVKTGRGGANVQFKPEAISEGVISRRKLRLTSRALIKNIWTDLICKETFKPLIVLYGAQSQLSLSTYIYFTYYGDQLIRHYKERPNLVPILRSIPPKEWKRDNLFSRDLWIKGTRKTTVIDRMKDCDLFSFDSKAQQRWIFSKNTPTISFIFNSGYIREAQFLADIKIDGNLPVPVYRELLKATQRCLGVEYLSIEKKEILVKMFLRQIHEQRKTLGKRAAKSEYSRMHAQFSDWFDWLRAEGAAQGFPNKNSTWQSLHDRSNQWHELQTYKRNNRNFIWKSLIEEHEDDNFQVQPLTSSHELAEEGRRQHHCVGGYDYYCNEGTYRVFNIKDKKSNKKYTLGLEKKGRGWAIQQVRGFGNSVAPDEVMWLSKKLAIEYTSAERVTKKRATKEEVQTEKAA